MHDKTLFRQWERVFLLVFILKNNNFMLATYVLTRLRSVTQIPTEIMKQIFIIFCFLTGFTFQVTTQTYAETNDKAKFGIKRGVNASIVSVSLTIQDYLFPYNTEYKYNAGFNVGMFVEFPLTKTWSFQPELSLSVKGMRSESFIPVRIPTIVGFIEYELHTNAKISLYYIILPLYLKTCFNINNSGKLIAGIGPYVAYGTNGMMRCNYKYAESYEQWNGKKKIFKEDDIYYLKSNTHNSSHGGNTIIIEPYWHNSLKRFDGGVSGFIGYELYEYWSITASYDLGLINLLHQTDKQGNIIEGKMYNRTISLSLGYKF